MRVSTLIRNLPLFLFAACVPALPGAPLISEFMADNDTVLQDEDGDYTDWIEIYNPDSLPVDLAGYHLSDDVADLSMWTFPSLILPPNGRVVVFASGKDRATAGSELHTNFQLSADGEFLALIAPDGTTVLTGLDPVYPPQYDDVAFGLGIAGNVTKSDVTPTWVSGDTYASIRLTSSGYLVHSSPTNFDQATGVDRTGIYFWMDWTDAVNSVPFGQQVLSVEFQTEGSVYTTVAGAGSAPVPSNMGLFPVPDADFGATSIASPSFTATSMVDYYAANTPLHSVAAAPGDTVNPAWDVTDLFQQWIDNPSAPQRGQVLILNDAQPVRVGWSVDQAKTNLTLTTTNAPSLDEFYGYMQAPSPGSGNLGTEPAGPVFLDFTEDPPQPVSGPLTVTAEVSPFGGDVMSVSMFYRMAFESETEVTMTNDGNGIYSADIPASKIQPGQMVRWRFEATDANGHITKEPAFRDPATSAEYHGTVTADPSIESNLTVLHTFIGGQYLSAVDTIGGGFGSVYYLGQFYDNVRMNRHGQSTGGFPKKSYNFDFPSGDRFRWSEDAPRVRDIDLLTNWADKSKVRHVLSYEIMRNAGVKAHFAFTVRVQRNGQFFSTADFVEDADEIYLERAGLNPDGSLYKVYSNRLNKDQGDGASGMEQKAGQVPGLAEVQEIIDGLDLTGQALENYIYDNVNLPMCVNMCAANAVIRNTDMHSKNWYLYRDKGDSDEWGLLPWDLDLAHGRKWNSTDRYFDNALFTNGVTEVGTAVRLVNYMFSNSLFPEIREMIYRRMRTLSDDYLAPPYFENRLAELSALIDPPEIVPSDARQDFVKWGSWTQSAGFNGVAQSVPYTSTHPDVEDMAEGIVRWHNEYLPGRRDAIFNNTADLPASQSGSPLINFGTIEFAPATGNQDEEYIELNNPNSVAVDLSGWELSEAVGFTFEPGTVIPGNGTLYVTPDKPAFRAMATRPNGGNGNFLVGDYSGHLSSFGETIRLLDASGAEVNSVTYTGQPSLVQANLVISELMYHPEPNGGAEYIELMNIHPTETLNLSGVAFTDGVEFNFTGSAVTTLAPGERVLVVRELAAFEEAHGAGLPVAGVFANNTSLSNSGETIKLEDADNGTVKEFTYNDKAPWPVAADEGYSLVLINPSVNPDPDIAENWRSSAFLGGSPGGDDTQAFAGDPQADIDGNGQADLLDYAMFGNLSSPAMKTPSASVESVDVDGTVDSYVVLRFLENIAAEDAEIGVEMSNDLTSWQPAGSDAVLMDTVNQGDGTALVRYRSAVPAGTEGEAYLRIRATLN